MFSQQRFMNPFVQFETHLQRQSLFNGRTTTIPRLRRVRTVSGNRMGGFDFGSWFRKRKEVVATPEDTMKTLLISYVGQHPYATDKELVNYLVTYAEIPETYTAMEKYNLAAKTIYNYRKQTTS